MASKMEALKSSVESLLAPHIVHSTIALDELTVVCKSDCLVEVATKLRDSAELSFEQCIDMCGMDYSTYRDSPWDGPRFAAVYQLLSLKHNQRIRLRCFAEDDDFPVLPTLTGVWSCLNWYEREAFDLFGLMFDQHPDLRRILTDYGFVGHPFRKDFPVSGFVEMRYDASQQRVIYQPVSIEPREITPRIIREENYGG
ncbi:NADH-quinone oxidoreductase subunit C [Craterilacuibacter sinensis]|uniref:NADH-quinone oxidoreductase subunit C n=1 Tax=Craterilacuibacter sinensis TaxID=2686017 RepID=A0A845BJL0_9NEIS|nr:NADH-quinone oxidoreductase subunit C [Craterilacuibacter sinensis]MXR35454.1 NADH-quinone oxidoreductase subunit C [Craterilacuibacter sinensis]RQW28704.1 NADH-quinone oxidoreductase subunit C [Rhodobacteraceae bacterium CH30]